MQGLGGLAPGLNRGASMSGNKGGSASGTVGIKLLAFGLDQGTTAVSGTFLAASPGVYEFALFGNGASAGAGGLCVHQQRLRKDDSLPYVVGSQSGTTNTTVTLPDSAVLTAQAGGNGGGASGGNLANLTRSSNTAPSYGPYIGGTNNATPGGGQANTNDPAGAGMIVITKIAE